MSAKTLFKAIKKRLQTLRIRAGKMLLDRTPRPSEKPLSPESIGGILFLRQDGKIGDYIVSSFAFREIKKAAPHIRIGVVCTEANRNLFERNPHIDAVHIVEAKSSRSYKQVGRSIAGQYDVLIDPTAFVRNRDLVLIRSVNAPYNIGFDKAGYRIFNRQIAENLQHFSEIYRQALNICGFSNVDTHYELPPDAAAAAEAAAFLKQNGLKEYAALNFFGAARSRQFNENRIRDILAAFTAKFPDTDFVLLTYPAATPMLEKLCREFNRCRVFAGTRTVWHSIELIRRANMLLTPDTSTVHAAAAFGIPTVALYSGDETNFRHWHPNSPAAAVIRYRDNINEIPPSVLEAAVSKQLAARKAV